MCNHKKLKFDKEIHLYVCKCGEEFELEPDTSPD